ncbi:hypothetical protein RR46_04604 [Papilio xuthus]|uniref:Uncharacterized protein n=1 Tax=Papilio xuthus TaxID=66420 RepID=A0A194PZ82_PAPXU|nr:hypothetical protein RR46_04604 [Papilio xuthus]
MGRSSSELFPLAASSVSSREYSDVGAFVSKFVRAAARGPVGGGGGGVTDPEEEEEVEEEVEEDVYDEDEERVGVVCGRGGGEGEGVALGLREGRGCAGLREGGRVLLYVQVSDDLEVVRL